MRKIRWLCAALSLSLLFGVMPVSASAFGIARSDVAMEINWLDLDLREVNKDITGEGWDWDATNQVLTLDNFNGVVYEGVRENSAAILLPEDSTLHLKGNNVITTYSYRCRGIYSRGGMLIIEGNGILNLNIESMRGSAFYIDNGGSVAFCDKTETFVETAGHVIFVNGAKGTEPIISVENNAKLLFPKEVGAEAIYVIKSSQASATDSWFNYEETYDNFYDAVTLVSSRKPKTTTLPNDVANNISPEDTVVFNAVFSDYQLTIGSTKITKDGEVAYDGDAPAYISNGYTMLPLRALIQAMDSGDVDVQWDAATKTATIDYNGNTYVVCSDYNVMLKNGEDTALYTSAEITDGRMYLSLRDWMTILEIPSSQAKWNPDTKTVTLTF